MSPDTIYILLTQGSIPPLSSPLGPHSGLQGTILYQSQSESQIQEKKCQHSISPVFDDETGIHIFKFSFLLLYTLIQYYVGPGSTPSPQVRTSPPFTHPPPAYFFVYLKFPYYRFSSLLIHRQQRLRYKSYRYFIIIGLHTFYRRRDTFKKLEFNFASQLSHHLCL